MSTVDENDNMFLAVSGSKNVAKVLADYPSAKIEEIPFPEWASSLQGFVAIIEIPYCDPATGMIIGVLHANGFAIQSK